MLKYTSRYVIEMSLILARFTDEKGTFDVSIYVVLSDNLSQYNFLFLCNSRRFSLGSRSSLDVLGCVWMGSNSESDYESIVSHSINRNYAKETGRSM